MSTSFQDMLTKSTGAQEQMEKEQNQDGYQKDVRYWKPETDKEGNGEFLIRFLPPAPNETTPYRKRFQYFWKNPDTGRVYAENARSTLAKGTPDPMAELNRADWNRGYESVARARKRRERIVANIVVIKDKGNPENEGKQFLFEFGPAIFKMIEEAAKSTDIAEGIDVFHFLNGANFYMPVYSKEMTMNGKPTKLPQYDKCRFMSPSALFDGDHEKLKEVWENQYPLDPEIVIKSYDDLKKQLEWVLGNGEQVQAAQESAQRENKVDNELSQATSSTETTSSNDDDEEEDAVMDAGGSSEEDQELDDILADLNN